MSAEEYVPQTRIRKTKQIAKSKSTSQKAPKPKRKSASSQSDEGEESVDEEVQASFFKDHVFSEENSTAQRLRLSCNVFDTLPDDLEVSIKTGFMRPMET